MKTAPVLGLLIYIIAEFFLSCAEHEIGNAPQTKTESYALNLEIKDFPSQKFYLAQIYSDKPLQVDTLETNNKGLANFQFSPERPSGIYRVYAANQFFEFIYNHENIILSTSINDLSGKLEVIQSRENKLYGNYQQHEKEYNQQLPLLQPILDHYPQQNQFFDQAKKELKSIQQKKKSLLENLKQNHPNTYATRLIRFEQMPELEGGLSEREQITYLQAHFLDHCDFQDTTLHYSSAYNKKLLDYLKLFNNPSQSKKEQATAFIRAASVIMSKARQNPNSYIFTLEFLLDGFEQLNMKEVLNFLAENYDLSTAEESCENEDQLSRLRQKLAYHQQIAPGKQAPDISLQTIDGQQIQLSDIQPDYRLLVFWSSQCPHCKEMLPHLKGFYREQDRSKFEVIAVSLDTEKVPWESFIQEGNYDWVNSCDLKGWEGDAAVAYHVYATPVMVLVNGEGRIVAKPKNVEDLRKNLRAIL